MIETGHGKRSAFLDVDEDDGITTLLPTAASGFGDVADQWDPVESAPGELKYLPPIEQLDLTQLIGIIRPFRQEPTNLEWT